MIFFLRNGAGYVAKSHSQGSHLGFSSVTLVWLLNLSDHKLPHLYHEDNNSTYLIELLKG